MSRDPRPVHDLAMSTIACCGICIGIAALASVPICASWFGLRWPISSQETRQFNEPHELPAGADAEGYLPGERPVPYFPDKP